MSQFEKYIKFKVLHEQDTPFVIPNCWDAGSARLLARLGFEALATTSAGLAFSLGKLDSAGGIDAETGLTRDEVLENARAIVLATDLPVSADLEGGYGDGPEHCAAIIRDAVAGGLVGGSIEDATGDSRNPFYPLDLAADRIRAAADAARDKPFLLTARTENYLYGNPDLRDTIKKLQAFEEAGADVLFAPGINDLEEFRILCAEVGKPVNALMGIRQPTFSIEELARVGVRRISVGGGFARAAMSGLMVAAREVLDRGTFSYTAEIISNDDACELTSAAD